MLNRIELKVAQQMLALAARKTSLGVVVLVSGGHDSMALLTVLVRVATSAFLRDRLTGRLAVLHFNHQKRGVESDRDEALVAAEAERHSLPFRVVRWNDSSHEDKREEGMRASFQVRARRWRYREASRFCTELKQAWGVDVWMATAHHARDHAETLLLHLIRGCGLRGLEGISAVDMSRRLWRPFCDLSYLDLQEYVNVQGVVYREDASNATDVYRRNVVRHRLLPLIAEMNPGYEKSLLRLSAAVREVLQKQDGSLSQGRLPLRPGDPPTGFEIVECARATSSELVSRLSAQVVANLLSHIHLYCGGKEMKRGLGVTVALGGGWQAVLGDACLLFRKDSHDVCSGD